MKRRFNKNWQRKIRRAFLSASFLFFILIIVAFSFKSISPEQHNSRHLKVKIDLPEGDQFQALLKSKPILHLYAGQITPYYGCRYGSLNTLQINDKICSVNDIHFAVYLTNKDWLIENNPIRAELRADKNVKMGFIMDIKRQLQKVNWVHFNYIQAEKYED